MEKKYLFSPTHCLCISAGNKYGIHQKDESSIPQFIALRGDEPYKPMIITSRLEEYLTEKFVQEFNNISKNLSIQNIVEDYHPDREKTYDEHVSLVTAIVSSKKEEETYKKQFPDAVEINAPFGELHFEEITPDMAFYMKQQTKADTAAFIEKYGQQAGKQIESIGEAYNKSVDLFKAIQPDESRANLARLDEFLGLVARLQGNNPELGGSNHPEERATIIKKVNTSIMERAFNHSIQDISNDKKKENQPRKLKKEPTLS